MKRQLPHNYFETRCLSVKNKTKMQYSQEVEYIPSNPDLLLNVMFYYKSLHREMATERKYHDISRHDSTKQTTYCQLLCIMSMYYYYYCSCANIRNRICTSMRKVTSNHNNTNNVPSAVLFVDI